MQYLLDTNICIYIIKRKPRQVIEKFQTLEIDSIGLSSITLAELQYGTAKSQRKLQNAQALSQFLLLLPILNFDQAAANCYGILRAELEQQGQPIGAMDLLIAAHALSLNLTLVTNNTREFARIPNLSLENWAT
jgi:tRNA(fMet)-specific endonuclease VapC